MASALSQAQYTALEAMGIPVWESIVSISASEKHTVAIATEAAHVATDIVLPLQANPAASLMIIGAGLQLDATTPVSRLFTAMLSAVGLSSEIFALLAWQDHYQDQLMGHLATGNVTEIIMFGEQIDLETVSIPTILCPDMETLLAQPAQKVAVWRALQNHRRA